MNLFQALKRGLTFTMRWWKIILLVVCGGLFTIDAFAGTYNFYFSDKNKKHKEESVDSDDSGTDEKSEPFNPSSDSVKTTVGREPIIINNVNNNDNTNKNVLGQPVPAYQPPAVSTGPVVPDVSSNTSEERVVEASPRQNKFRFRLAAGYANQKVNGAVGSIGLGYQISKTVAIDGYAGAVGEALYSDQKFRYPYAGIDLIWMPFRLSFTESWDLVQLGFIAGGTTLVPRQDNIGTLHGGVTAALSLGPNFSIVGACKANLAFVDLEAGIVTRF
ncbi:MAG: hypothetical protein HYR96_15310 [Deltaproteobacteria bacterium]|nr:hypothetical protein [Deltaproteobacteria bacterium]MBI3296238.1 hypothetical protein [Deltaproteobacteria bacterium]